MREAACRLESRSDASQQRRRSSVSAETHTAEQRVGVASGNVTTAAGSVEELAASIAGIAEQATRSTEVASPGGRRGAPHRRTPWRSSATPPPASARWSG